MTKIRPSEKPKKTAYLNKDNWEFVSRRGKTEYWRHKTRRKVKLQLHKDKLPTGLFWDTNQKKVISELKIIRWKNG